MLCPELKLVEDLCFVVRGVRFIQNITLFGSKKIMGVRFFQKKFWGSVLGFGFFCFFCYIHKMSTVRCFTMAIFYGNLCEKLLTNPCPIKCTTLRSKLPKTEAILQSSLVLIASIFSTILPAAQLRFFYWPSIKLCRFCLWNISYIW